MEWRQILILLTFMNTHNTKNKPKNEYKNLYQIK